jgi:hypothetical protein
MILDKHLLHLWLDNLSDLVSDLGEGNFSDHSWVGFEISDSQSVVFHHGDLHPLVPDFVEFT